MGLFTRILLLVFLVVPVIGSAQAQTPSSTGDWTVVSNKALDVAGEEVVLSPDGTHLAVVTLGSLGICIYSVDTLDGPCLEVPDRVDMVTLTWAPDSSAIAYVSNRGIHVMDAVTGADRGLTGDGTSGTPISDEGGFDVYPVWSPDSTQLVYARSIPGATGAELVTVPVAGGEPVPVEGTQAPDAESAFIYPPIWLENGSIFYTQTQTDDDLIPVSSSLWRWQDGSAEQLFDGAGDDLYPLPGIQAVAPDGSWLIGQTDLSGPGFYTREVSFLFVLDLATGEIEPLETLLPLDAQTDRFQYPARFSPDGSMLVYGKNNIVDRTLQIIVVGTQDNAEPIVIFEASSDEINIDPMNRGLVWASNETILIPTTTQGSVLITLEPTT